jgi:hypothetical protein
MMADSLFENVMKSPNVWTGKDGVKSVTDLLSNPPLQDKIQQGLLSTGYNKLLETGAIKDTAAGAINKLSGSVLGGSGSLIAQSQETFANTVKKISQFKLAALERSGKLSSTINEATSASAVALGKSAIASANLSALSNLSAGAMSKISSQLSSLNIGGINAGGLAKLAGGAQNLSGAISKAANNVVADVGALVGNAGKFGAGTATQWAQNLAGGADGTAVSSLSAGAQGAAALIANNPATAAAASTFGSIASIANNPSSLITGNPLVAQSAAKFGAIAGAAGSIAAIANNPASLIAGNPLIAASAATFASIPGLNGALTQKMNAFAGQNKFAVNFGDFKLPGLAAGAIPAAAYSGTIDRSTVDSATNRIIGSNKVASPLGGAAPTNLVDQFDSFKQQAEADITALQAKADAANNKSEGMAVLNASLEYYLSWSALRDKITNAFFTSMSTDYKFPESIAAYFKELVKRKDAIIADLIARLKQQAAAAAATSAAASPDPAEQA